MTSLTSLDPDPQFPLPLGDAKDGCDTSRLGIALRLALLCEIDQSALPLELHAALRHAAQGGQAAATVLLNWRDRRLLDAIEELEGRNVAQ